MEVKIGVQNANRELTLDVSQSTDDMQKAITDALTSEAGMLVLTDDRGRTVYVPVQKLAYVEILGDSGRRVGFGAA